MHFSVKSKIVSVDPNQFELSIAQTLLELGFSNMFTLAKK